MQINSYFKEIELLGTEPIFIEIIFFLEPTFF